MVAVVKVALLMVVGDGCVGYTTVNSSRICKLISFVIIKNL